MKTTKFYLVTLFALAAFALPCAQADQPNMKDAIRHLEQARASLERATPNKAGHREKAMELIRQAIAEVQAGMADAR